MRDDKATFFRLRDDSKVRIARSQRRSLHAIGAGIAAVVHVPVKENNDLIGSISSGSELNRTIARSQLR